MMTRIKERTGSARASADASKPKQRRTVVDGIVEAKLRNRALASAKFGKLGQCQIPITTCTFKCRCANNNTRNPFKSACQARDGTRWRREADLKGAPNGSLFEFIQNWLFRGSGFVFARPRDGHNAIRTALAQLKPHVQPTVLPAHPARHTIALKSYIYTDFKCSCGPGQVLERGLFSRVIARRRQRFKRQDGVLVECAKVLPEHRWMDVTNGHNKHGHRIVRVQRGALYHRRRHCTRNWVRKGIKSKGT